MEITMVSSRDFNHDTGAAKKAARKGPVFITDRGRQAHVLLTIEQYEEMTTVSGNIIDLLAMPGAAEINLSQHRRAICTGQGIFPDVRSQHECRVRTAQG